MMSIKVISPGLLTTIQDSGRMGFAGYGVPKSGAMDRYSAKIANLLVGNKADDAVIEMTLLGPKLEFLQPAFIVLVGLEAAVFLNGSKIALLKPLKVEKGDSLHIKQITQGARLYLAICGGFQSENVMGSKSQYESITKTSALKKEAIIPFKAQQFSIKNTNSVIKYDIDFYKNQNLEVYPGPEYFKLSEELKTKLLSTEFSVSKNNSRMAYQLEETIANDLQSILTQPVLPGTVQFTPSGSLIILMRDCQTTGGYPRIFQLTKQSINLLAQKKPGDLVQFQLKNNE